MCVRVCARVCCDPSSKPTLDHYSTSKTFHFQILRNNKCIKVFYRKILMLKVCILKPPETNPQITLFNTNFASTVHVDQIML